MPINDSLYIWPVRFVSVGKFCEIAGKSEQQVRDMIAGGSWVQNRDYRRAPDRHLLVDLEAYQTRTDR